MNIRPLADRVLVEPKEAETKTAKLKVGDTVLYGKYSGTEITVDGKDYLMMRQSDVLAVL